MTGVLIRKGEDTERQREEDPVKTQREIEGTQLQAKKHHGFSATTGS